MLVCKVEKLFGENAYCCGKMAEYVITVGKINYLPLVAVEKDGVKYLTLDTLRETSFVIMPCDLQEVEV